MEKDIAGFSFEKRLTTQTLLAGLTAPRCMMHKSTHSGLLERFENIL